jgi:hypothetical protein
MYCGGGSVSGLVAGWTKMTTPSVCLVHKICTKNAQSYLVITEFLKEKTLVLGSDSILKGPDEDIWSPP